MKRYLSCLLFNLFFITGNIAYSTEIYSNINFKKNADYVDYRNFLINMGFKDYCLSMEQSLNSSSLTEVSKKVLEHNRTQYQIINVARELAAFTFSYSKNHFYDNDTQDRLVALTTFLLLPNKDISTKVIAKYSNENQISLEESFNILTKNKMIKEKELIISSMSEIIGTHAPKIIAQLDRYLSRYFILKYTDSNLMQTNYLGRAFVAGLIRFARHNKIDSIETKVEEKLKKHNIFLNNYISDSLAFTNTNGKIQTVTLHSGDFANEYSKGSEAYYISIGTTPTGIKNRLRARTNHLLGNAFKIAIYPTPETEKVILNKVNTGKSLSTLEKIQYSLIQTKPSIAGYSHAGIVDLKEDAESKIKMSWIWDSYPNDELGGIRFIGTEGFAFSGEFQKIGFVHYNPTKFLNYYKSQIASRGYLQNVWLSYNSKMEDGAIAIDEDQAKYAWPTSISENDVRDFANTNNADADFWFKNKMAPRVTAMMEKYFTGTEALAFADGFINVRGAAYCSQAVVLAYLQGIDIDPEEKKDRLSFIVHIGHILKLSELEDIDLTQRIISPAGFAWQTDLVETHIPIMIKQGLDDANTTFNLAILLDQLNDSVKNSIAHQNLNKFEDFEITELAY